MTEMGWPEARLSPIRRARVLAAALPSAAFTEGVIESPYRETWAWLTDFERSVPAFDTSVTRIRVANRRPAAQEPGVEHVTMTATSFRLPVPFTVRVEDGYCLMQARGRLYLVVMAAEPEENGERTRFLHMEAVPLPGTRWLRRRIAREVSADFNNVRRLASAGFP